jgi:hypothetical protein
MTVSPQDNDTDPDVRDQDQLQFPNLASGLLAAVRSVTYDILPAGR